MKTPMQEEVSTEFVDKKILKLKEELSNAEKEI